MMHVSEVRWTALPRPVRHTGYSSKAAAVDRVNFSHNTGFLDSVEVCLESVLHHEGRESLEEAGLLPLHAETWRQGPQLWAAVGTHTRVGLTLSKLWDHS